jgi:hypothetical protein
METQKGKLTLSYGEYEGEMRTGQKHGKGILTCANGELTDGYWFCDKFMGDGSSGKDKMDVERV